MQVTEPSSTAEVEPLEHVAPAVACKDLLEPNQH